MVDPAGYNDLEYELVVVDPGLVVSYIISFHVLIISPRFNLML